MMQMNSSNPVLQDKVLHGAPRTSAETMSVQGTINKALILFCLLLVTFFYSWNSCMTALREGGAFPSWMLPVGAIGGLILALVTAFKPTLAPYTSPGYALFEGLVIGAMSATMEMRFPGIVSQAAMVTLTIFGFMLFLYKTEMIRATERFQAGLTMAIGGVFMLYMLTFVLGLFGVSVPYIHDSGPIGIAFSVFVVVLASFSLIMDFEFIIRGERNRAPQYMEWYGAFGLMVTLIWLYIEVLRLLAKLNSRRD